MTAQHIDIVVGICFMAWLFIVSIGVMIEIIWEEWLANETPNH